jgi:hypothetical protein
LAMKQQGFLVGEGRTLRGAAVFAAVLGRHFDCLPVIERDKAELKAKPKAKPKVKSKRTLANAAPRTQGPPPPVSVRPRLLRLLWRHRIELAGASE